MSQWATRSDLLTSLTKKWRNQTLLKHWLQGSLEFPMRLSIRRPAGKELLDLYPQVASWIQGWQLETENEPVTLVFEEVRNRHIQTQQIPRYLHIECAQDLWQWLGCAAEVSAFEALHDDLTEQWPALTTVLQQSPFKYLELAAQKNNLIAVLRWFETYPHSGLYLRQLDISGVHTKFIEANKRLINDCLQAILPPEQFDASIISLGHSGFERKFGLDYDRPGIRFRILDKRYRLAGLSDLIIPLEQFAQLSLPVKHVVITENKINGLAFPALDDAIVIFGLGYGAELLAEVPWLSFKNIWYWGDIDTHGFNILAQFRKHWPQTRSMLMDEQTLLICQALWVEEPKPILQFDTTRLQQSEREVLEGLWQQRWHTRAIRLEQEVIPFHLLEAELDMLGDAERNPQ